MSVHVLLAINVPWQLSLCCILCSINFCGFFRYLCLGMHFPVTFCVQMENRNQELADENSCLHEEIERLRITLDQHLSESSLSGKVCVVGAW